MNIRWAIVALALGAGAGWAEDPVVRPGDSYSTVVTTLGEPTGLLRVDSRALLTYERGKVELVDDKVVRVDLISSEEAARRRQVREQAEAEALRLAALRRAALAEEGEAVRAAKLADPSFQLASAADQVEFWRNFRARYTEVDVTAEYAAALRLREAELAKHEDDGRLDRQVRELEARVVMAEDRARQAEDRADRAERDRRSYGWYSPVISYASYPSYPSYPSHSYWPTYPAYPVFPTPKPCPPKPPNMGVHATMRLVNGASLPNLRNMPSVCGNAVDVIRSRHSQ